MGANEFMQFNILEMVLGQIPEALYFSLFMIFTKQLKEKRIAFILLMTLEYLIIQKLIHFNIWLQVIYTLFVFVILKLLYKEKAQITDIFTFTIASIVLISIDVLAYFGTQLFTTNYFIAMIVDRILIFTILLLLKKKLPKIQQLYKKLWNRNDSKKKKIKSTTFRCINLIFFNISFYAINLMMIYCIFKNSIM